MLWRICQIATQLNCFEQVGKAMLVRMNFDFFEGIKEGTMFIQYALGPAILLPDFARGIVGNNVVVSDRVQTNCGLLKAGDVVWLRNPWRLASLMLAVQSKDVVGNYAFSAIVRHFAKLPSGSWSAKKGGIDVVQLADISTVCSHLTHGGLVYV